MLRRLWLSFGLLTSVSAEIIVFSLISDVGNDFDDLPANFGDPIPEEGITALLVYSDPPEACTYISPPPPFESLFVNVTHWAVLIRKGDCSFEQKVLNAQNASYDIAIVHNVDSDILEEMVAEHPEKISIISTMVGSSAGRMLKDYYLYNQGVFIKLASLPDSWISQYFGFFMLAVGAFCVMKCCGYSIQLYLNLVDGWYRRSGRTRETHNSILPHILTAKFRKGDPYETCAICLDDFVEGERLRILPCSHAYHCKCIDPWFIENRTCPLCKKRVTIRHRRGPSEASEDSDNDDTTPLLNSGRATQGGTFTTVEVERAMRQQQRVQDQL